MPFIRIIDVPPGDAPLHVRRAWVGMLLPMDIRFGTHPLDVSVFGVIFGPRGGRLARLWALLTGRAAKVRGYVVDAPACVELLAAKDPGAAEWWREYAPHMMAKGRYFVFPEHVCELVWEEKAAPAGA